MGQFHSYTEISADYFFRINKINTRMHSVPANAAKPTRKRRAAVDSNVNSADSSTDANSNVADDGSVGNCNNVNTVNTVNDVNGENTTTNTKNTKNTVDADEDTTNARPTKRRKIAHEPNDSDDLNESSEEDDDDSDDEETEEDRAFLARKIEKIKSKDEDTAKINPANIIEGKRTRKPVERYVHPDEEIVTISHGLAVPEEELIAILEMEKDEPPEQLSDEEYKPESSDTESEEISESEDVVSESETYASESEESESEEMSESDTE